MELLSKCPVCSHSVFNDFLSCKDFVATGEVFKLVICAHCDLVFTNPRPDTTEIGRYYQTTNYVSHAGKKKGLIYWLYDIIRRISLGRKLQLISGRTKGKKLLDVGCGLGYFLNAAHRSGWDARGVDVSKEARNYVKTTFGIEADDVSGLDTYSANSFDAITLWHVLEHFHNLEQMVQKLKRLLAKEGVLFVAVPNSSSYDAAWYDTFWDGYDVPRHLYHFRHKPIEMLMEQCGLVVAEKLPMIFDSYYISWRSEIHKKTFLGIVRAFVIGQLSNWKAKRNANYSSVLYVIKHA